MARRLERSQGDRCQSRYRNDGQTSTKGQALHHARGQAHTGETAGATCERDGVEIGERDTRFTQELIDHGQQQVGVAARGLDFAHAELPRPA